MSGSLPGQAATLSAAAGEDMRELGRELLFRWAGLVDETSGWSSCADGGLFNRAKRILYPDDDIAADFERRCTKEDH